MVQKNLKQLIFTLNELNISNLTRNDTRSGATKTNEQAAAAAAAKHKIPTPRRQMYSQC